MEVDEENDEFENVNLIEDVVFYLREKVTARKLEDPVFEKKRRSLK